MNDRCLPSGEPGRFDVSPRRAREGVPRVPEAGPNVLKFIGFCQATLWEAAEEAERPYNDAGLLSSVVYRPTIFCRNEIGWIAACASCAAAKPNAMRAAKSAEVR
jgi:hypothetical protein